ncbi:ribonuclease Z [Bilifractor sp. LCP19S3_H10]|uniref:ribonuclease Z n=1 Tax=Bilifractor sp. LCP19S3_H10 TaxID=3438736 RepID=UPI003F92FD38
MIVITVIEDRGGMMFNHRRLSRDRVLTEKIKNLVGNHTLWIDAYSATLFPDAHVDEDFLQKAGEDDFCFVEDRNLIPYKDRISTLYLFYWNRRYPADLFFNLPLAEYEMISQEDFPGYSHDKITLQKYVHRGNGKI